MISDVRVCIKIGIIYENININKHTNNIGCIKEASRKNCAASEIKKYGFAISEL